MDNLSSHKRPGIAELIKAAGASLLDLPSDTPDFNPIEKAFSKLKALLRKAGKRTLEGLWTLIGKRVDLITLTEAMNDFISCGHDPE